MSSVSLPNASYETIRPVLSPRGVVTLLILARDVAASYWIVSCAPPRRVVEVVWRFLLYVDDVEPAVAVPNRTDDTVSWVVSMTYLRERNGIPAPETATLSSKPTGV